jgi:hypothetical protein
VGTRLIVLAALLAVVASGCGAKKVKVVVVSTPSTTTAATSTTTSSTTTTTSSSSSAGTIKITKFATTGNCAKLEAMAVNISKSINPSNGQVDPQKYADAIQKMADAAPSDIKSDFKTFADAYSTLIKAYTSSGYTPGSGKVPTAAQIAKLTAASKALSTPKVQTAVQHLTAWGKKNCGVG